MRSLLVVPLLVAGVAFGQQAPSELEAVVETDLGVFRFEFAADKAPRHVENFIRWARRGDFDGSAFHRVVSYGIIQGGDPLLKNPKTPRALWGSGGLKEQPAELSDMKHERGVISTVSLPGVKDSDGHQFFVCISAQPPLDGRYSAFGRVTEGMEVVEKISQVKADAGQVAEKPVRIIKVTIEKKKVEPFLNTPPAELHRVVRMKTTLGQIRIQMEPDWAPNHVRNFLKLVDTGWYNGTVFHRLLKGFVAQGGMATGRASGPTHPADRWLHTVKAEFRPDLHHTRGMVSMARGDDPDSADTSFFLLLGTAAHLDGQYTLFGRVIDGLDVLDAFEKEEVKGEAPARRLEIIEAVIEPQ